MINEQDKQAILNGAPGITKNGLKAVYIGKNANDCYPYYFALFEDGYVDFCDEYSRNLTQSSSPTKESEFDIVGLWEESIEQEPFNLERALNGEPVLFKNGLKGFVLSKIKNRELATLLQLHENVLVGYAMDNDLHMLSWDIDGNDLVYTDKRYSIAGMWQEPKRPTVTLTLPCPLKSLDNVDTVYAAFLEADKGKDTELIIYEFSKENFHQKRIQEQLVFGSLFASREDAEAWEFAKQNNRR